MRQLIKKKNKDQKGFTLIELLAVIVILGIIAAIAIPSITQIIQKSKADAIRADAKIILNAGKLYQANGNTIDATNGVTESQLGSYVDHVTTFTHYTVKSDGNGGALTISGTGTKDNVSITFNSTDLDHVDTVNPN
jgi:type IV pilus assembly protein PilA